MCFSRSCNLCLNINEKVNGVVYMFRNILACKIDDEFKKKIRKEKSKQGDKKMVTVLSSSFTSYLYIP